MLRPFVVLCLAATCIAQRTFIIDGPCWLDPAGFILVDISEIPPDGEHVVQRHIDPVFPRGTTFTAQSVVLDGGDLLLSSPAVAGIR